MGQPESTSNGENEENAGLRTLFARQGKTICLFLITIAFLIFHVLTVSVNLNFRCKDHR